jgi:thioredoxin 1
MATIELTTQNFEEVITKNEMVVIDFWAQWCGPCRNFAPIYTAVSQKYPQVVFAKINTETEHALANHFNIRSIPTLMIFRQQIILFMQAGSLPASALEEIVDEALALDMDAVRAEVENH